SCATAVLLLLPTLVVVLASFTSTAYLSFPPERISLRWYARLLSSPEILRAGRVSVSVACLATMGSLVMGLMTAFPLARGRFKGRDAVLAFRSEEHTSELQSPDQLVSRPLLEITKHRH